ncbi:MAG TPA: response regulator transcription factor, partial [Dehalococcoidia bacterium]|nr:response regulator transcription factor [Dehalococcoidia bacterium]
MSAPRILVVDDEMQLRRTLVRSLAGHGYDAREAVDGASAVREFSAFKPDVVLLDLMLPDRSGVDVCRELREVHATPIIVLSVIGEEAAKVQALDAGADDYLTKPFGMDELLARVRVALRRGAADREQQPVIRAD